MKKIFEKITSISLAIISLLFIILIIAFMFKPELASELETNLVRVFVIVFASAFLVLTALNIYASFADNERLSNVLLFKDKESATKATVGVVKKTAKRVTKNMEVAKIRKVTLFTDSSGNITMNIEIKLNTDDTMSVITNVRALIIETFNEIFNIEFVAINFRIIKSKNRFVPKEEDVSARMEDLKSHIISNKPLPGTVQTSTVTGDIVEPPKAGTVGKVAEEVETAQETAVAEAVADTHEVKAVEEVETTEEVVEAVEEVVEATKEVEATEEVIEAVEEVEVAEEVVEATKEIEDTEGIEASEELKEASEVVEVETTEKVEDTKEIIDAQEAEETEEIEGAEETED